MASQPAVTDALETKGLLRMDYKFDSTGARVLMNAGLSIQSAMLRPTVARNGAENRRSAGSPARPAVRIGNTLAGEVAS